MPSWRERFWINRTGESNDAAQVLKKNGDRPYITSGSGSFEASTAHRAFFTTPKSHLVKLYSLRVIAKKCLSLLSWPIALDAFTTNLPYSAEQIRHPTRLHRVTIVHHEPVNPSIAVSFVPRRSFGQFCLAVSKNSLIGDYSFWCVFRYLFESNGREAHRVVAVGRLCYGGPPREPQTTHRYKYTAERSPNLHKPIIGREKMDWLASYGGDGDGHQPPSGWLITVPTRSRSCSWKPPH